MNRLFLFCLLCILSVSAYTQANRTHQLHSRDLAFTVKDYASIPPKKLYLKIINAKSHEPVAFAKVYLEELGIELTANEWGIIEYQIPSHLIIESIALEVNKRRYFSKTIDVKVDGTYEINKTIQMRFNKHSGCFKTTVCPSF